MAKLTNNQKINKQVLNTALDQINQQGKIGSLGGNFLSGTLGTTFINPTSEWYARVLGDYECTSQATTSEALESTDTKGECCTTSETTTGYRLEKVYPAGCGTWKTADEVETGIGYELNNYSVPTGTVVKCTQGFADEWLFAYGGFGTSSALNIPWKCRPVPVGFDCEVDENGDYTGNTVLEWENVAVLDIDCDPPTSNPTSGATSGGTSELGGGEEELP